MGRTFLQIEEDSQYLYVKIVKVIDDYNTKLAKDSSKLEFLSTSNNKTIKEAIAYNRLY